MDTPKTPEVTPELLTALHEVGWFKGKLLLRVLARADFRCEYCGQDLIASFNECFNAQKDHVVPQKLGGKDVEENLAACCLTCNALKWDYEPQGHTREEKVADAARHIQEERAKQKTLWDKYRKLIRNLE